MSDPFLVLLPPSEGKTPGGHPDRPWTPESGRLGSMLGDHRAEVVSALRRAKGGDATLLGARGDTLETARGANLALADAPTLPAWRRYSGVVWSHLSLDTMPADVRRAAVKRILVPSGLLGICLADDPVPDHRLAMGVRLAPMGRLSAWWREPVSGAVARIARGRTVVDLLPQEHRAAIDPTVVDGLVRVDLVSRDGGRVGGHDAKAAKGLLARHLLCSSAPLRRSVSSFRHPDYVAVVAD